MRPRSSPRMDPLASAGRGLGRDLPMLLGPLWRNTATRVPEPALRRVAKVGGIQLATIRSSRSRRAFLTHDARRDPTSPAEAKSQRATFRKLPPCLRATPRADLDRYFACAHSRSLTLAVNLVRVAFLGKTSALDIYADANASRIGAYCTGGYAWT